MNEQGFWKKVKKTSGCWLWTGATGPQGYGHLSFDGRITKAHRISWMLANGPIPGRASRGQGDHATCVLHRCDVRNCVRPSHLFIGTQADNLADMTAKGRRIQGETHPNAKLTDADVRHLRDMRARGVLLKDIAREFGVCRQTAGDVAAGNLYRHVQ